MIARKLTTDEIRNSEGRNYNPQVWDANIDRMVSKYNDVQFYMAPNGGFYRLDIEGITNDGKTMRDLYNLVSEGNTEGIKALAEEIAGATIFDISFNPMHNENGDKVVIATTPTAREWMIERCTNHGMTFTKGF